MKLSLLNPNVLACSLAMSNTHTATAAGVRTSESFYLKEEHHPENGTMLGFWLYLMSDCLLFAMLFAAYGVLGRNYAAGPSGADLFDLKLVAINTAFLLLSSITYGFAMLSMYSKKLGKTLFWLGRYRHLRSRLPGPGNL